MKTAIITSLAFFLIAGTASCRISSSIPNEGSEGAQTFRNKCGMCHALPHPSRHTRTQWEHTLKLMDIRIQEKNLPELSSEEKNSIREYVFKHARKR